MVLPIGEIIISDEVEIIDEATLPTRTYKLDLERGRCIGMTEGLKAMEQAIFKALSTIRFKHLIYSDDYGFENPIGHDEIFVRAELPRRIRETLLQDERISAVENMSLKFEGDSVWARFTCITIYGDVNVLREVNLYAA
jgi:hypothetical protein